jgi:hypothetical protein
MEISAHKDDLLARNVRKIPCVCVCSPIFPRAINKFSSLPCNKLARKNRLLASYAGPLQNEMSATAGDRCSWSINDHLAVNYSPKSLESKHISITPFLTRSLISFSFCSLSLVCEIEMLSDYEMYRCQ